MKTNWFKHRLFALSAAGVLLVLAGAALSPPMWEVDRSGVGLALLFAALLLACWSLRQFYAGLYGPLRRLRETADDRQDRASVDQQLEQVRMETQAQTDQRVRRELSEEIGLSVLPQVLPDYPSRENFAVCGLVLQGNGTSCCFYDYFFIDPGLLCVSIGQVPGGGVPEALYMVVAQTTVRSRLRQGRSLSETMADVNAQLYDLGRKQSFSALVGTLNTADGRFHYINAGEAIPLLMRSEGRYEWLEAPVYAPLGMNENVTYREMNVRLRQGDRILFHTSGLGETPDAQGRAYREQELRSTLNRSAHRGLNPEETLGFLQTEAAACCKQEERLSYAAALLEFRKGDKELAHCEVPGEPSCAKDVTAFLKKQFLDNGMSARHCARVAVVVDELFALCCRRTKGTVMVECGIAPDAQMVNIRITALLGGASPLEDDGPAAAEAAAFIQDQADYVTFKPGENAAERDTLTVVCFLE